MSNWLEYQSYVMKQLETHGATLERIMDKLNRLEVELAALKVKSSVWGFAAGAIPAVGTILILLWKSHAGIE